MDLISYVGHFKKNKPYIYFTLLQGGHYSERPKKQEKTGEKTVDLGKKQELAKPKNSRKPVVLTKKQEKTVVFRKNGCLRHGLFTETLKCYH